MPKYENELTPRIDFKMEMSFGTEPLSQQAGEAWGMWLS